MIETTISGASVITLEIMIKTVNLNMNSFQSNHANGQIFISVTTFSMRTLVKEQLYSRLGESLRISINL